MAAFLNALHIALIDDSTFQVIDLPFRYQSDIYGGVIEVPVGFKTDFASVPRIGMIYALLGDTAHEPAVVHDWLYDSAPVSRSVADDILLEAMKSIGMPSWRRYPIWWGVRMGGWYAWNQHRRSDV